MIERRLARAMFRVHDDEFLRAGTEVIAIPKAGVILKPVRCDLRFIDAAFLHGEPASPPLGSAIEPVGRGYGGLLLIGPGDFRGRQNAGEFEGNHSRQGQTHQRSRAS